MDLRITPNFATVRALDNAARHTQALANLQQQASTGLRLIKPSDDPEAMRSLLLERIRDTRWEANLQNIQDTRGSLNGSVTQLLDAKDILFRARQVAVDARQPIDEATRELLASEVDAMIDRLLNVANSQFDDRYLFAGTAVATAPFSIEPAQLTGTTETVSYAGADEARQTLVLDGLQAASRYSGADVFLHRARQETIVIGSTGARSGTGTDSAVGRGTLQTRHVSTSYAAGSGIQAGVSSPGRDSILGPAGAHTLTIVDTSGTGTAGTVSLNGGPAVAFTDSDADLRVDGPGGQVVYVNTTAIAAGFAGDVAVTADGEISVDGGQTYVALDFSGSQQLVDSVTGQLTHVDTSEVRAVGTDDVEYVGTSDAFRALFELRDDLRNTRNLSETSLHESLGRRIGDLDRLHDHLLSVVGDQSIELENLDALEVKIQDLQLASRKIQSEKESADLAEVATRLQQEQVLLQFAYASMALLLDQSFLDFIR